MDSDSQKIIEAIERFRAGSAEAFNDIYEGCYRLVYTTCFGILKNEEDARDVAQDVFVRIYEKIDTLNNPVAYGKWMKQIASNMSMDHIRRGSHTCSIEDDADLDLMAPDWEQFDSLPDSFIEEEEKREIIDKVLRESLSEVQYQTIFMYYFSEMPLASIAESMECPEGTVKTRLMHAKEKFRKSLEKYVDDNKLVLAATPFLTRFFNASSPRVNIPDIASLGIPGLAAPSGAGAGTAAGAAAGSGTGTAAGVAAKAGFLSTIAGKIAVGAIALTLIGTATVIAVNLAKKDKPEETGATVTTASDTSGSGADASGSGTDGAGGTDPVQPVDLNIGDEITFGNYSGKDIEWIVLDENDSGVLLLSKNVIDTKPYNESDVEITWENCTLRGWINNDFYYAAFSPEEQSRIIETNVVNSDNADTRARGGSDTNDRVFILSMDEANKYLGSDEARRAQPCDYLPQDGSFIFDGYIFWWLRTPGNNNKYAAQVGSEGGISGYGDWVTFPNVGVRPAIWVSKTGTGTGSLDPELSVKTGDYVLYGNYEQDGDLGNGSEPIEWRIFDVQDGKALLLSRYALDSMPYNETPGVFKWENCSLRSWLNTEFYTKAFSSDEQEKIELTYVVNADNPDGGIDGGNDTTDKVFLLSLDECIKYFNMSNDGYHYSGDSENLFCLPTQYALSQGVRLHSSTCCCWWLRSPGDGAKSALFVNVYEIPDSGEHVHLGGNGVRPAMWVDAKDLKPIDQVMGVRVYDSPVSTTVSSDGSEYDFKIPMVKIEGVNTDEANKTIEKEIGKYLGDKYGHELMSRYVYFMNDKIVSIIVYNEYTWFDDDWKTTVFNIDLKTGRLIGDGEVVKLCGLTDKTFFANVKTIYKKYNDEGIAENSNYSGAKKHYEQNLKRISYRYIDPYIGPDGHLCFAGQVNYIGGGGGAPVMFDMVTMTWHF